LDEFQWEIARVLARHRPPSIDAALVQRLLDAFGPNGSRLSSADARDSGKTVSGGDAP